MKEYLDAARETVEYMNAITRMNRLSEDPFDHAKIINLGATAWAMGDTPEMMNIFGRIASSMRITAEDIRQLEHAGIENRAVPKPRTVTYEVTLDTGPFEEALKRSVEKFQQKTRPWLDAKSGEAWVIDVDGYPEPLAVIVDDARFETHMAAINKTDPRITDGHRIWPAEERDGK